MKKLNKRILKVIGMSIGLFLILLIWYGYSVGQFRYQIHTQTIYFEDLPEAFDGYKVVQFSDMHIGTLRGGHESKVQDIVNLINGQKADAIFFTGDLVNLSSQELEGFESQLSQLSAPDGVFSVMGNHDYSIYSRSFTEEEKKADVRNLREKQKSYGWHQLVNQNKRISRGNSSIVIAGVENSGYAKIRFPRLGRLDKALKNTTESDFIILLSHDPTHWTHEVLPKSNVQLTLSGHTHAGQFKVCEWSPVKWTYSEWSGIYMQDKRVLNVSEGVGCLIPFRVGAWPEINVITLRKLK